MSRGPGRWQRAILAELERREQFFLRELLPEYPTQVGYWTRASPQQWVWEEQPQAKRAEAVALYRAAYRLAARRIIALDTSLYGTNHRQWTGQDWQRIGRVIVARPSVTIHRFKLMFAYEEAGEAERRRSALEGWQQRLAREGKPLSVVNTETTTLNSGPKGAATMPRSTAQLGAIASLIKLLAREGPITEDLIVARAQEIIRWPPAQVLVVLDQLKVSGDYQRIVDESRRLGLPDQENPRC